MSGSMLQSFNVFASRADLDEEHKQMGRKLCNVSILFMAIFLPLCLPTCAPLDQATGTQDQFISSIVTVLSVRQEICSARDDIVKMAEELRKLASKQNESWKGGKELKVMFSSLFQ
jgi:hypothetical protein